MNYRSIHMLIQRLLLGLLVSLFIASCSDGTDQAQHASVNQNNSAKHDSRPQVINPAPDFTLNNIKGGKISLSDFKDQVVLINFWATWCPPCRAEIPEFINVYRDTSTKGFAIIGIALDSKEYVDDFVDNFAVNYPIAYGNEDVARVSTQYKNTQGALPYNVILDRDHNIVYAKPGPMSKQYLLSIVEPLL